MDDEARDAVDWLENRLRRSGNHQSVFQPTHTSGFYTIKYDHESYNAINGECSFCKLASDHGRLLIL